MTIDFNLRVLPLPDRAFLPGVGFPVLEGQNIIEVKYRVTLPAMIKQLSEQFKLRPQPVSKAHGSGRARSDPEYQPCLIS